MLTANELTWEFKENENLLFHYTSYFKALSILESNSLWAGQLSRMNDPLEFRPVGQSFSWSGNVSNGKIFSKMMELAEANRKRNNSIRLLSFSIDDFHFNDDVFEKQVVFNNMLNHGWARTRMWAQYGDCHKGVCLVFEKNKLLEATKKYSEIKTYSNKIEYTNDMSEFQEAFDLGFTTEDFKSDHSKAFMQDDKRKFLFQKCDDFMSEQEFRCLFISDSFNKDKPFVFDYKDSLVGVIISDCFDSLNLPALKNLADDKKLPIFRLMWQYGIPTLFDFYNATDGKSYDTKHHALQK